MDLLPRDAELARRAAGGDGAAFVRLYDSYSEELFEAALAANESVETAAKATQTSFLRILRRPPALDAPDSEVATRLRRLVPGGPIDPAPTTSGGPHPRASDVGWLRSETVAMAGARFDDDWSVHLWSSPAQEDEPAEEQAATREEPRPSRLRFALPRLGLPSPAAAVALVGLTLLGGALGTFLTDGGQSRGGLAPAAATRDQPAKPEPAKRSSDPRPERGNPGERPMATPAAGVPAQPGLGTRAGDLAMKPPPVTTVSRPEKAPAADEEDATPQRDTPPGAQQDGSAGDRRNCHSKKATDSC